IPKMEHGVPHNEDGTGGANLYMPWWLDNKKLNFPRGYHIELGGGKRSAPGFGFMGGIQRFNGVGGYGKSLKDDYRRYYGANVGRIIHEVGTTRMGNDPKTSVLNAGCQAHDVRNLFVADAGPFVSNSHKNCTWTILALSMRTAEHIARQRNQGTL